MHATVLDIFYKKSRLLNSLNKNKLTKRKDPAGTAHSYLKKYLVAKLTTSNVIKLDRLNAIRLSIDRSKLQKIGEGTLE